MHTAEDYIHTAEDARKAAEDAKKEQKVKEEAWFAKLTEKLTNCAMNSAKKGNHCLRFILDMERSCTSLDDDPSFVDIFGYSSNCPYVAVRRPCMDMDLRTFLLRVRKELEPLGYRVGIEWMEHHLIRKDKRKRALFDTMFTKDHARGRHKYPYTCIKWNGGGKAASD